MKEEQKMVVGKVFGRFVRFVKFTSPAMGGGGVQVKVRKELLNPMGRNVSGILHLGKDKIYIPEDGQITIGRSKECDIRIKDPRIDNLHVLLLHVQGNEFQISNISSKEIIIGKEITLKPSSPDVGGYPLADGDPILLPLSGRSEKGNGRYLKMELETFKPNEEGARLMLAMRPPIKEISPEHALDRVEGRQEISVLGSIDPKLVEGSIFKNARTIAELNRIYDTKVKQNRAIGVLGTVYGFSGTAATIIYSLNTLFSFWISTSPIAYILGSALMAVIGFAVGPNRWAHSEAIVAKELAKALEKLEPEEMAKFLAQMPPEKKNSVWIELWENDPVRADRVKSELSEVIPKLRIAASEAKAKPEIVDAEFEAAEAEADEAEAAEIDKKRWYH